MEVLVVPRAMWEVVHYELNVVGAVRVFTIALSVSKQQSTKLCPKYVRTLLRKSITDNHVKCLTPVQLLEIEHVKKAHLNVLE